MSPKFYIFVSFLLLSLTYSFFAFSQSEETKIVKNCLQIKDLLRERKLLMEKSIEIRKQKASDINSSLNNLLLTSKVGNKTSSELQKFYEETDTLILEREELVNKISKLQSLDCENDKLSFLTKLKIFNNNYKAHLKKEIKIREDFEENTLPELREVVR